MIYFYFESLIIIEVQRYDFLVILLLKQEEKNHEK